MQVILLTAWTSSRMSPISDKSLLKICWKSVVEHQINNILSSWIDDFLIICNEKNILEIKNICKNKKWNFNFVIQKNQKDWMKWAIESCWKLAKKEVFIISSNDIVEKSIFEKMLKESQKNKYFWLICGKVVDNYFPGGYISLDENWFLNNIVEKPWEWNEPSNKINLVLHIWNDFKSFQEKILDFHNSTDDAYEKVIKYFSCEKEQKIKIIEYSGFWQAIKYPWHLFSLTNYFLNLQKESKNIISSKSNISKSTILKGDWIIVEKWVKIFENAIISGPCYIWENSIIGSGAFIRESSIGKNCTIWFNSEIARSLIQNNVWTHNNYIWDSIIDKNVSFWAGTITWNLRLDEEEIKVEIKWEKIKTWLNKIWAFIGKNCRFWINLSLNPWIKVWENSMIWWWISIVENIEKNSLIYGKVEIIKKANLKEIKKR